MKRKSNYVPRKDRVKRTRTGAAASAAWRASAAYQRNAPRAVQETKYFDTSQSQAVASAADWTGTEVPCTNYVQSDGTTVGAYTDSALIPSAAGSGYGQVNGSKYFLKKVRVRGILNNTASSDQADMSAARTVRVVLVHDTQPNGAQAQGEDVFIDMGNAVQNNYNFLSMGSGNGGRFRILSDETFVMDQLTAGTDGANTNSLGYASKEFSMSYTPKKPIQVNIKPNSVTPTTAALANHNIFLLAHSTATGCTISACARAYFCD